MATDLKKPVLEIRHIYQRFETTQALDDVSLDIYPGEIHALLGENGAGKSTLIKILTGVQQPDQGEILLDSKPIRVHSSVEAQAFGLAAIYQEPMLFPDLTAASLSAHEVAQLFKLAATLRQQGVAILFISHRMEEVFEIADRVTVLRDGKTISSRPISQVTPEGAIRDMVGRKIEEFFAK